MRDPNRPILLIDDSEDDAELVTLAMRQAGITAPIDVVRSGEAAFAYLFGEPNRAPAPLLPVVVLLDLHMPRIDGFAVLQRIRREPTTRTLPTVMVSSSGNEDDIAKAYELGANSYVRKAVDFAKYADIVRQVATYWLVVSEHVPLARGEVD